MIHHSIKKKGAAGLCRRYMNVTKLVPSVEESSSTMAEGAGTREGRDEGMQKHFINEDVAVSNRTSEEISLSLQQSNKLVGNAVRPLEDGFAPPLSSSSAFLALLDKQDESASTQDILVKGGMIDGKDDSINMELALEESKQGETPVEMDQKEPARKASAGGRLELPCLQGQSIVPEEALSIKEPSSIPAREDFIDADDENHSHDQEGLGTLENHKQNLQVKERQENGSDGHDFLDVVSNQVEVDNDEQGKTDKKAVDDDALSKGSAQSAKKVTVQSGQELGMDTSADEQDTKAALGKEPPHVLEQESDQKPLQEHLEQSLETASSSCKEMAADTGEKGNSALALIADEDTTNIKNAEGEVAAPSEEVTTDINLKEHNSENEAGSQVAKGKQGSDDSYNREVREIGTQAAEAEGRDINAGKGKEIAGSRNGVQSSMDAARTSDSVDLGSGSLKLIEENFEKDSMDTLTICIADNENVDVIRNGRNREDRAPLHLGEQDMDCTARTLPVARQTNWWECCGMFDLLLRKDE